MHETITIDVMDYEAYIKTRYPHVIPFPPLASINEVIMEMAEWAREQFGEAHFDASISLKGFNVTITGPAVWTYYQGTFRFMKPEDAMLFKLRWA